MALYVGREDETRHLLQLREKPTASLVVCQGRRRIGKSTFIQRSADKLDHFLAFEGLAPRPNLGMHDQLGEFSRRLAAQTSLPELPLENWPQALQLLASTLPKDGWTLVLLDEVSWLSTGDPDFPGHLKAAWDNHLSKHDRLILVLCGSVSSWIQENILSSPAFVGRCSLEIRLGPLALPHCNEFWRGRTVSPADKLKALAVTGGVPRYLEELNPSQSAEQNIHRLCFQRGGLLFREFDQIFRDIFGRRAETYQSVVTGLVDGSRTVSQIGAELQQGRGGTLSASLEELALAGLITRDVSFDPTTGQSRPRAIRYRLSDNYLRFYLKYVAPRKTQIEKNLYVRTPLESLIAWDTIFGLQIENLVLTSFESIREQLGLDRVSILNAGPYRQTRTQRREGCQVDLLIRTKHATYVIEIKLQNRIEKTVIGEVKQKVKRLDVRRDISVRTALVYSGTLSPSVRDEGYFDHVVSLDALLEG